MAIKLEDLPTHEDMVRNIVRVYASATDFDKENGLTWYPRTREYCRNYADLFEYPLPNVVGAYAVLSPSLEKEVNDRQIVKALVAHKVGIPLERVKLGVYGKRNRVKAERCLSGDLTAVKGNKVERFYRNIMGLADDEVTVDRWALKVALNRRDLKEKDVAPTNGVYMAVRNVYIEAADILGVKPLQCQAVTWEAWRNKYYKQSKDTWK